MRKSVIDAWRAEKDGKLSGPVKVVVAHISDFSAFENNDEITIIRCDSDDVVRYVPLTVAQVQKVVEAFYGV